jgi:hypothetical protein
MKLIEAIKQKGTPFEIPDCSRDDLPELFRQMGYKVGVEIGVYKGEYTEKFLQAGLKMYAVDPWGILPEYPNTDPSRVDRQQFLYGHALKALDSYIESGQCKIVRKTSMEAVRDFNLESLDFVYIDGNHEFRYVAEDIYEWAKRIKKGGIISGHDYFNDVKIKIDVKCIVDAYVKAYKINPWYVLGREEYKKGEVRDKWRSWMWVKK